MEEYKRIKDETLAHIADKAESLLNDYEHEMERMIASNEISDETDSCLWSGQVGVAELLLRIGLIPIHTDNGRWEVVFREHILKRYIESEEE